MRAKLTQILNRVPGKQLLCDVTSKIWTWIAQHTPTWPTLWKFLNLKIYSGRPWLVIVPIAAWGLDYLNHYLGLQLHLPTVLREALVSAFFLFLAHLVYALACPPPIKNIGSSQDWDEKRKKLREESKKQVESERDLSVVVRDRVTTIVNESCSTLIGKDAFSEEQTVIIRTRMFETISGSTDIFRDLVRDLKNTTDESYDRLTTDRPIVRLLCLIFAFCAAAPFVYEIGVKGMTVLRTF